MDGVYMGGYTTNQTAFLAGKTLFMGELMCFADRIGKEATVEIRTSYIPEPLYSSETQDKYTTFVNNKGSTYVVSKKRLRRRQADDIGFYKRFRLSFAQDRLSAVPRSLRTDILG
jgi:hypothetical protein